MNYSTTQVNNETTNEVIKCDLSLRAWMDVSCKKIKIFDKEPAKKEIEIFNTLSKEQRQDYVNKYLGVACRLGGDFRDYFLQNINFDDLDLSGSWFIDADLTGASFKNAILKNCEFENCKISKIDFTNADLENSCFDNSKVKKKTLAKAKNTNNITIYEKE